MASRFPRSCRWAPTIRAGDLVRIAEWCKKNSGRLAHVMEVYSFIDGTVKIQFLDKTGLEQPPTFSLRGNLELISSL